MRIVAATVVVCLALVALVAMPLPAHAQKSLADDLILLSKAKQQQDQANAHQHLATPGKGESPYRSIPGANVPRFGEPIPVTVAPRTMFLQSPYQPPGEGTSPLKIGSPALIGAQKAPLPLYGALDLPLADDEGPADGLTLDIALERLVQVNYDLLVKSHEIPKADADILTAGLRNNPLLFASADNVPYGNYSPTRPGETGYSATVIQAIDINQKRLDRIKVAKTAKRVLEAQYQDAIRLEIDNLYSAYVDVLRAQTTVRFSQVGQKGLSEVAAVTKQLVEKGLQPKLDLDRILIQQANAEIALRNAEATLRQAKHTLAVILNIPAVQVEVLALRGKLRGSDTPAGTAEELVRAALQARPDLAAFQMGVERAQAEVGLTKKERVTDVFVLYTPYGLRNNQPTGGQNASSWGVSAMVSLPIFNRNQGNIRRAEINVSQTRLELAGLERVIEGEVYRGVQDVTATQGAIKQFEERILPSAKKIKDGAFANYSRGQEGLVSYLGAQRDYNETLSQYLDVLARHRRNVLKLNTVVGQRIQP